VEYLDLNKLDTVRTFAKSYIESKRPIHVLMNNAGIMALKDRKVTEDGNEFQVSNKNNNNIKKKKIKIKIIIIIIYIKKKLEWKYCSK